MKYDNTALLLLQIPFWRIGDQTCIAIAHRSVQPEFKFLYDSV